MMDSGNFRDPIIITGAPRSGKTMIATALSICGAFHGDCDNMLENKKTTQLLHRIISGTGADPFGINPLPDNSKMPIIPDFRSHVQWFLSMEGLDQQRWFVKTSLCTLTWRQWDYSFPNAKWIIVRRRTGDIAESCLATAYIKGHTTQEGFKGMVNAYDEEHTRMIQKGLNATVIWPARMADGDYSQLFGLLEWTGLKWNAKVLPTIDPKFWKTRNKET